MLEIEDPLGLRAAATQREIAAMSELAKALQGLDTDAVRRVLDWSFNHFLGKTSPSTASLAVTGHAPTVEVTAPTFDDFPTLLGSAKAETGLDRAILVAYYLQVVQGNGDFDAFSANRELKHAGHASGNITRDLDALQSRSPQLIIQTRKQGNSQQARKLYKLTSAGIAAARAMINS